MGKSKNGRDGSKQMPTSKRWEALQELTVELPEPSEPSSLQTHPESPLPAADCAHPELSSGSTTQSYSRLRVRLRDLGLPFQAQYNQGETAQIIVVSDRTVRDWTNAGKMPCCHYPYGRPYYTPQNIEDYLTACERPRPRKAAK